MFESIPETELNPDYSLQRLKEGNQRYVANKATHPNQTASRRADVAKEQKPFAIIIGCADSRVPPEIIFDQGLGDLFVIRTAGQVLGSAALGSIEFGVKELGIGLILILGHERCGAVRAVLKAIGKPHEPREPFGTLVHEIKPAIHKAQSQPGDLLDNAVRANVALGIERLKTFSKAITKAVEQRKLKIAGAYYDLDTGAVDIIIS